MTNTPLPGKSLPSTGAVTGLKETLAFFADPSFTQQRFEQYGNVFETRLLAQRIVFMPLKMQSGVQDRRWKVVRL